MQNTAVSLLFQSALNMYQKQQLEHAERLCKELLQHVPKSADALHLMALCLTQRDAEQSQQFFRRAISQAPGNVHFKRNYANFLLAQLKYTEAEPLYSELYRQMSGDPDIAYGLAFVLHQQKQHRASLAIINNTALSHRKLPKWQVLQARALLDCGDIEAAEKCLLVALQNSPTHPDLISTRIMQLRLQQRALEALNYLELMPENATRFYLAGCLQYDLQHYNLAELNLQRAIAIQPDYIDAHVALNKLYWEHNKQARFLNSFNMALAVKPLSVPLYLSYISHLLLADKIDLAISITEQGLQRCGSHHQLQHALGTLYYRQGKMVPASHLYQQALQQAPANIRYLLDSANLKIQQYNYSDALVLLEKAVQIEPDNQEVWAYLGLCWHLTGNEKHIWLNNYQHLVWVTKLGTPAGYGSFKEFWFELKAAINNLHATEQQPLDQSVRNGTQTVGFLFHNPEKVIQIYQDLLKEHINQYLASLPNDPAHPLLRRNSSRFRFSGCWSVKLNSEGFHTNHVHPQGWLSVCTYLQVPDCISATDPSQQGWLKLGETSLNLGARELIARSICPEEGLCVIFPSYMWHGTVPFTGANARITLPCDIVPDL